MPKPPGNPPNRERQQQHWRPLLDYRPPMPDADKFAPADPSDLAAALAYALRYQGRKRVHNADEIMSEIVAKRLVEHLRASGLRRHEEDADRWRFRGTGAALRADWRGLVRALLTLRQPALREAVINFAKELSSASG